MEREVGHFSPLGVAIYALIMPRPAVLRQENRYDSENYSHFGVSQKKPATSAGKAGRMAVRPEGGSG